MQSCIYRRLGRRGEPRLEMFPGATLESVRCDTGEVLLSQGAVCHPKFMLPSRAMAISGSTVDWLGWVLVGSAPAGRWKREL